MNIPIATALRQLYDFETKAEEAVKGILESRGIKNVFTRQLTAELEPELSMVQIRIRTEGETGHKRVMKDKTTRPDAWSAQLTLHIVTPLTNRPDAHTLDRSVIRAEIPGIDAALNKNEILPYWRIYEQFSDAGTTPLIKSEDGYESSTLLYRFKYNIRPQCWPLNS